jgi:5-methylcytosine-specific restriction protein B
MTESIAFPDHPHKSEIGSQCSNPACRFEYFGLIEVLKEVNSEIRDEDYHLGISFFLTAELPEHIEDIWRMEIEPYLEEYFFDQRDKLSRFRWDAIKGRVAV